MPLKSVASLPLSLPAEVASQPYINKGCMHRKQGGKSMHCRLSSEGRQQRARTWGRPPLLPAGLRGARLSTDSISHHLEDSVPAPSTSLVYSLSTRPSAPILRHLSPAA